MKIREIVNALERFAPLPLQDDYDNSGLQIGLTETEATGALLCLDVNEDVVQEALELGCNLIVSHHPLIFSPLKSITGKNYIERCVIKAIKNDISIYSAHTSLDNAPYGVSYKMATILGLKSINVLAPKEGALIKLVVYVPNSYADRVREVLFESGCGHVGYYDRCSFNAQGIGTFRAEKGSEPYIGQIGESVSQPETRIETVFPLHLKEKVLKALLAVHPYQEPAYDLISLKNGWENAGCGVIGNLPLALSERDFLRKILNLFGAVVLKHNEFRQKNVVRVALCGGSGAFLIDEAIKSKADAFVTGEIGYHRLFGHRDTIFLVETGHYESEQFTVDLLKEILKSSFPAIRVMKSGVGTNPTEYFFN